MRPFLFYIGSTGVPAFFFMVMIGSLAATWTAAKFAKREGLQEVVVLDLGIIAIIASILGARIFHILVEAPDYYIKYPIRVFYFWQGGFVSLGAFIGSIGSCLVYLRIRKLNIIQYLDVLANAVPVVMFFVRVGCFLTGCCYGKETHGWLYIVFKNTASTAYLSKHGFQHLYPTQIFNMMNAIVLFFVLLTIRKHRKFYGQVSASFLIYYGITRFIIEFFRGDVDRGVYFDGLISVGQIVMTGALIIGIIMWVVFKRLSEKRS